MSNDHGYGHGRNSSDVFRIDLWALLLAGFVAFCFAVATEDAPVPNIGNRVVDEVYLDDTPADQPAPEACTDEEAVAAIYAAGYATVQDFQTANGLTVDGVIGPQTKGVAC